MRKATDIEMKESSVESWDRIWASYNRKKYEYQLACQERSVRWQHIEALVRQKFGSFARLNCMEIGAGSGHHSMLFARRGANVTLLDYSEKALDFCSKVFKDNGISEGQVRFVLMNALNIDASFYDKFNISMSFGVAEHFKGDDRRVIVKTHLDVLKKGGITFISVPYAYCIPLRVYSLFRNFKKRGFIECYPYSKHEFRKIASGLGTRDYYFIGSSYLETYNPISFYRRKKEKVIDILKLKEERASFLDRYLGREITFIGDKTALGKDASKPKVLMVGPASPSTGGIPSYLDELLASHLKDHFQLELFDPLILKKRPAKQKSHLSFRDLVAGIRVIGRYIKILRRCDPRIVHIHTSSYWGFYEKAVLLFIAKYIFSKRTVFHIHGGEFDRFYSQSPMKKAIEGIIRSADKALIVSKPIREILGSLNLTVVDNCTYFDDSWMRSDKSGLRKKYGIDSNKTVFISLVIFEKRKGIFETLESFKRIVDRRNDFVYLIAGEGPELSKMRAFVKENGLYENVKIFDFVSGQKKKDLLLLADIFILNSSHESFAMSLIEAVSNGLFVITTPVGIASKSENVFNDTNCIHVPIKDIASLKEVILKVLNKEVDTDKIRVKSFYDFKSRFDVSPVCEKMRLIYEDVLNS